MEFKNPSPKDKRILKAHRKRYVEDKNLSQIAEDMDISYETVKDYFREESTERIKQMYDEDELEFMRLQLLNMSEEARKRSESYLSKAVGHEDTKPSDYIRAAKEEQKVPERWAKMLQEIGLLDKPKERKEVEQKGGPAEVNISMERVDEDKDEEKQSVNTEEDEEVEAEQ